MAGHWALFLVCRWMLLTVSSYDLFFVLTRVERGCSVFPMSLLRTSIASQVSPSWHHLTLITPQSLHFYHHHTGCWDFSTRILGYIQLLALIILQGQRRSTVCLNMLCSCFDCRWSPERKESSILLAQSIVGICIAGSGRRQAILKQREWRGDCVLF